MTERIEDRLKKMICERLFLRIPPEDMDEKASLEDTYDVDSVSLLELIVGLEEEFGVVIEDEDFKIEHFQTVSDIAAYVREKSE